QGHEYQRMTVQRNSGIVCNDTYTQHWQLFGIKFRTVYAWHGGPCGGGKLPTQPRLAGDDRTEFRVGLAADRCWRRGLLRRRARQTTPSLRCGNRHAALVERFDDSGRDIWGAHGGQRTGLRRRLGWQALRV